MDRVFEKVRPRSLVGGGTSVYMYGGELESVRGSSLQLVSTPFCQGGLVQPEELAGVDEGVL